MPLCGTCCQTPVAQQGIWARPCSCKSCIHFEPLHGLKTRRNPQLLMGMMNQLYKTLGFWGLGSKVCVLGFISPNIRVTSLFLSFSELNTTQSAESNSTFCSAFLLQWLTQPALWVCPLALRHLKVSWNAHRGQSSFYFFLLTQWTLYMPPCL